MIAKKYKIENVYFEIALDSPRIGMIRLPIDWKRPDSLIKEYIVNMSETEFDNDMIIMLPVSLGNDWAAACINKFQERVSLHINQFKRITPADLECYVAELILILHSIGKTINQPISQEQRQLFFKKILTDISEHLNIPVELKFANLA